MRIVLDTNVLVSGTLNPGGPPGRIVDAMVSGRVTVLYDDRILREYRSVMLRPFFGFGRADVETLLDFIGDAGEAVAAAPMPVRLPDASDLPFLEVAAAGSADALVTGNARHFRPSRGRHAVHVCSPAEFLRRLG